MVKILGGVRIETTVSSYGERFDAKNGCDKNKF